MREATLNTLPIHGNKTHNIPNDVAQQRLPGIRSMLTGAPPGPDTFASTSALAAQPFRQGMPHLTGQMPSQHGFASSYRGYAHNSIESLPSTAVSSPHTFYSDWPFDNSSSGYESANYATRGSVSSVSASAQTYTASCSKRKPGSQSSVSYRDSKRSCSGSPDEESDVETSTIRKKRDHKKSKKTKTEKIHRSHQSSVYQNMEDALELYVGWKAPKEQKPGNRRISGCDGNKQQNIEAFFILAEVLLRRPMRGDFCQPGAPALKEEVLAKLDAHFNTDGPRRTLPHNSLMSSTTGSAELPCPFLGPNKKCSVHDDYIQCRKHVRGLLVQSRCADLGHPSVGGVARRCLCSHI